MHKTHGVPRDCNYICVVLNYVQSTYLHRVIKEVRCRTAQAKTKQTAQEHSNYVTAFIINF